MGPKRRRVWVRFALAAVLAAVGLFVLSDVASGVVLFVAMGVFFAACIHALKDENPADLEADNRRNLGWIWF